MARDQMFLQFGRAAARPGIRARFEAWVSENPHVYERFRDRTLQMVATGRKRYSARTIMEVLRWEYDLTTTGASFKIPNVFIPHLSRRFRDEYPEHDDFFIYHKELAP